MDDVTTAADLDAMSPAERHADFESRVVTDPDEVRRRFPRLQAGIEADLDEWLAGREAKRA